MRQKKIDTDMLKEKFKLLTNSFTTLCILYRHPLLIHQKFSLTLQKDYFNIINLMID